MNCTTWNPIESVFNNAGLNPLGGGNCSKKILIAQVVSQELRSGIVALIFCT